MWKTDFALWYKGFLNALILKRCGKRGDSALKNCGEIWVRGNKCEKIEKKGEKTDFNKFVHRHFPQGEDVEKREKGEKEGICGEKSTKVAQGF